MPANWRSVVESLEVSVFVIKANGSAAIEAEPIEESNACLFYGAGKAVVDQAARLVRPLPPSTAPVTRTMNTASRGHVSGMGLGTPEFRRDGSLAWNTRAGLSAKQRLADHMRAHGMSLISGLLLRQ
jgi:hypothetical protein